MNPAKEKDINGRWICKALFVEWWLPINQTEPVFTIQDYDRTKDMADPAAEGGITRKFYPSLYKLYMAAEDPIEFDFATEHLGSYDHWSQLCDTRYFKSEVERWRKELALKLQSRALKLLAAEADSGSKNAYSANKFLVEKGWVPKEAGKRGRPSKEAIAMEADLDKNHILEVYNRLNLQDLPEDVGKAN